MACVLADLTLESLAATALALRLAGAADRGGRGDAAQRALLRVALPAAKYWVCKRAPFVATEALECLGGNGYVEDSGMPRLLRDSALNSIWEGSGNVTALDVLRALSRTPEAADVLLAEIDSGVAADSRLSAAADSLRGLLKEAQAAGERSHGHARRLAGQITLSLQASLLARFSPAPVADAFVASRLGSAWSASIASGPGVPFGTMPPGSDLPAIVERSTTATAR